ncbi:MAG: efflux RND transporter periplasmic adaptor subunit [Myxococcota bacterium]
MEVRLTKVPDQAEFAGRLQSVNTVDLRARVSGNLLEQNFQEGGRVEEGQLLLVIDPAPYQAEVARLVAEVASDKAAYEKARRDRERAQQLFSENVTSRAVLDRAIAAADQASAAMRADEAALEKARLDLEYTRIVAPASGVIGRIKVDIGNLVGPDTGTLATITQLDPIYAAFNVSERTLASRAARRRQILEETGSEPPPANARLKLSDGSVYPHVGRLDYIDPDIQLSTGTLEVRGTFPNPDRELRPGQFVTVMLEWEGTGYESILLPQSAVQESQLGTTVFVVDDENRASTRKVLVGLRRGGDYTIAKGLSAGERVVVKGLQKVRPGGLVTPVLEEPPPPDSESPLREPGDIPSSPDASN